MSYVHVTIGKRHFSIYQGWIKLLVYGSTYYFVHCFILKFLTHYSFNSFSANNSNDSTKNYQNQRKIA